MGDNGEEPCVRANNITTPYDGPSRRSREGDGMAGASVVGEEGPDEGRARGGPVIKAIHTLSRD